MFLCKESRKIIYSGDITEVLAEEFIRNMILLDRTDSPIDIICINSYGGEVESGLAMIDYIRNSPNYINFYCSGMQGSAQSLIPLAADSVHFTSETTHFMFHKGTAEVEVDLQSEADLKYFKKTAEALDFQNNWDYNWISRNSSKPPAYWKERMDKCTDLYIFAEEALELELIESISSFND